MTHAPNRFLAMGAAALLAVAAAAFPDGGTAGHAPVGRTVTLINYDEYRGLSDAGESFLVEVSRITCPYCAYVEHVLAETDLHGTAAYVLDLEEYRGTGRYDEIKAEFGITYVPTFFYVRDGRPALCMNNPLPENILGAETTNGERAETRRETMERIEAFVLGATGEGVLIDEEPLAEVVYAREVTDDL